MLPHCAAISPMERLLSSSSDRTRSSFVRRMTSRTEALSWLRKCCSTYRREQPAACTTSATPMLRRAASEWMNRRARAIAGSRMASYPVDSRVTTESGSITTFACRTDRPRMRASSISAAFCPRRNAPMRIEESAGTEDSQMMGSSSTPRTAISSGTPIPASAQASSTRRARPSIAAKRAVGFGSPRRKRIMRGRSASQLRRSRTLKVSYAAQPNPALLSVSSKPRRRSADQYRPCVSPTYANDV